MKRKCNVNDFKIFNVNCFHFTFLATFAYDKFFHEQIARKKFEHSYRVFKKVNRLAGPGQFPNALEYSSGEKPITVWCSNDYLGMSSHPEVKQAVRYANNYSKCHINVFALASGKVILSPYFLAFKLISMKLWFFSYNAVK